MKGICYALLAVDRRFAPREAHFPLHLRQQTPLEPLNTSPPPTPRSVVFCHCLDIAAAAVNNRELSSSSSSLAQSTIVRSTSPTVTSSSTSETPFPSRVPGTRSRLLRGVGGGGFVRRYKCSPYNGQKFLGCTTFLVCSMQAWKFSPGRISQHLIR